jgi:hypothetical protein
MITMAEGQSRVLHQSPEFTAAADPSVDPQARLTQLRGEAERALRMARVLAGGGFPDEALPLIAKAIGVGAAARLASLGQLAAGATMATPAQMRDLVERGALAPQAETALSALRSPAGGVAADAASLIEMAALAVAGLDQEKAARAA